MSEHAIEFLQKWIGEEVQAPAEPIKAKAETLARECAAKAAAAGIPLEDIQEEVGDIQELIEVKLRDAAEATHAANSNQAGEDPANGSVSPRSAETPQASESSANRLNGRAAGVDDSHGGKAKSA